MSDSAIDRAEIVKHLENIASSMGYFIKLFNKEESFDGLYYLIKGWCRIVFEYGLLPVEIKGHESIDEFSERFNRLKKDFQMTLTEIAIKKV